MLHATIKSSLTYIIKSSRHHELNTAVRAHFLRYCQNSAGSLNKGEESTSDKDAQRRCEYCKVYIQFVGNLS
jgi:hypothetical protein